MTDLEAAAERWREAQSRGNTRIVRADETFKMRSMVAGDFAAMKLLADFAAPLCDPTPITREWVTLLDIHWLGWKYSVVKPDQLVAFIESPAGGDVEIRTRGNLRLTCLALDIELEEPS